MKKLLITLIILTNLSQADYTITPDETYVEGDTFNLAPDGTYVSGDTFEMTPDGKFIGTHDSDNSENKSKED